MFGLFKRKDETQEIEEFVYDDATYLKGFYLEPSATIESVDVDEKGSRTIIVQRSDGTRYRDRQWLDEDGYYIGECAVVELESVDELEEIEASSKSWWKF